MTVNIVCDDGSTNMTAEIAEALGADVIRHDRNMARVPLSAACFAKLWKRMLIS